MNYDKTRISPAVQYAIRGGDEAGLAGGGGGVSQIVGVSMSTILFIWSGVGAVVAFGLLLFILLRLSSIGKAWDEREGD